MAVGLSVALATAWLNTIRGGGNGVNITAPAVIATKLHTADPGATAVTAPSANTTRVATTFGAPTGSGPVAIALSNSPSWASWASGSETISHVSEFDSVTVGSFQFSGVLTTPKAVVNGDTLTLTSLSVSLAPIAA